MVDSWSISLLKESIESEAVLGLDYPSVRPKKALCVIRGRATISKVSFRQL